MDHGDVKALSYSSFFNIFENITRNDHQTSFKIKFEFNSWKYDGIR